MRVSLDYGAVRRVPGQRAVTIGLIVGTSVVLFAIITPLLIAQWRFQDAAVRVDRATWTMTGPACPAITAATWSSLGIDHQQAFAFQGIAGVRAHGDVSCSVIDSDGGRDVAPLPICQLRAPFAVRLATPRGDVYLEPGAGQPVTLWFIGGQPHCVMGANPDNW